MQGSAEVQAGTKTAQQAPAPTRKFRAGVQSHVEQMGQTLNFLPGASAQPFNVDVAAYGFLRKIWVRVAVTGGVGSGTAAVYKPDAPWMWLDTIQFQDVNSAPIVSLITGYDLYLINKYGGYLLSADPKAVPSYSQGGTGGNSVFWLYIPLEIRARDGLGSLTNKNNATNFKVVGAVGALANVFSTNPAPTLPTNLALTFYMEAWWEPQDKDLKGRQQAQEPPAANTIQMWSKNVINHGAGSVTHKISRVGYLDRNIVFVQRDGTGARLDANFPDPAVIVYEGQNLTVPPREFMKMQLQQKYDYTGTAEAVDGLDNGVFVLNFNEDFGLGPGADMGLAYLPTTTGTRFEVQGSAAGSGTLSVLTNDINARDDMAIAGG